MNPSNNEAAGMKLPPPIMEQAPEPSGQAENAPPVPETGQPAAAERAPRPSQPPQNAVPAMPLPLPAAIPAVRSPAGVPATTQPTGIPVADDSDLIEKEWVNKAKQIVDKTREDPYKQSEELTVVKIDYMKKRYNKALKLNK